MSVSGELVRQAEALCRSNPVASSLLDISNALEAEVMDVIRKYGHLATEAAGEQNAITAVSAMVEGLLGVLIEAMPEGAPEKVMLTKHVQAYLVDSIGDMERQMQ